MRKNKLKLNWKLPTKGEDFMPNLTRFKDYLNDRGFRCSTIDGYVGYVKRFLEYAEMDHPSIDMAKSYREQLIQRHLSRSTLNNCGIAIKSYYKMFGEEFDFPFQSHNQTIPLYFDEQDIIKIFSACYNLKHYAMLMTLFYGCLRASELCNLDDTDLDLNARTLKVREGKGGKDGIVYLKDECTNVLKRYLEVRPSFRINGKQPLFFTDYGNRWGRRDLYKMFIRYKDLAQIEKPGGPHVFARHTPATIMVANGCDIRIVKDLLRHEDIRTTLRYAHVSDKTPPPNSSPYSLELASSQPPKVDLIPDELPPLGFMALTFNEDCIIKIMHQRPAKSG